MMPRAPITTGTVVVLSPHIHSTLISKSTYLLSFSVILTEVLVSKGTVLSMRRQVLSFLFFSTMSGLLAAIVLLLLLLLLLLFISSFTVFAGVLFVHQPCTNHAPGASVSDSSRSFCPYTKHLPEDSGRSQHADLLGPCHSSSIEALDDSNYHNFFPQLDLFGFYVLFSHYG